MDPGLPAAGPVSVHLATSGRSCDSGGLPRQASNAHSSSSHTHNLTLAGCSSVPALGGVRTSAPSLHAFCLELLLPVLQRPSTGRSLRVLDVGCGTGFIAAACALLLRDRGQVLGIDRSEQLIMQARWCASAVFPLLGCASSTLLASCPLLPSPRAGASALLLQACLTPGS
jgi:hypothetical protein